MDWSQTTRQYTISRALPYGLPLLFSGLFISTAAGNWVWLAPILLWGIGTLTRPLGEFSIGQLLDEYHFFHHSLLMDRVKTVYGVFFVSLNLWAFYFLTTHALSVWHWAVFTYGMIILNSNFAMPLAHDLMHAPTRLARWLATILLIQNGFFYLEADHIFIHHRYVGTPKDPATPRLGEPIYRYFARSIPHRFRLISDVATVFPDSIGNRMVQATTLKLVSCVTYLALANWAGIWVVGWVLAQFVFVVLIYESITYIQHYGLQRIKTGERFEAVQLQHAWNSFYRLDTYLYFMMPVHSIHHVHDQNLDSITNFAGPRMPLPFAKMMLLAYQPARWLALMNKPDLRLSRDLQPIVS
ncbi:fatty acid desaturase [Spirosoma sp. BT702]|uniref:Fatty acid desaturase n=1 Tax=Spirosoma profusum TaxID=2771354 RepID=A0A926Y476_9BACT|nr:fatty acid desaturase [Spirosoma profusum]MBD2702875.1 fatty acid desaturase [Spirosoma profusum]